MTHRNAPLSVEGRRRLIQRCQHRPIAHVANEMGISRACASKWVNRYRQYGQAGLHDRPSRPHSSPNALPAETIKIIEDWRRHHKWTATRIQAELAWQHGIHVHVRTISRHLARLGLNRLAWIDPETGELNRKPPQRIVARWPGHMIHVDVKKVGRIPNGGGHRVHGRSSVQNKQAQRAKTRGARAGYVYLHSAVDGFTRLAYTEPLPDEKGATAAAFWSRAYAFFTAHGKTRVNRVVTDNGSCYRSQDFNAALRGTGVGRHQFIKPYTPKHNGKVERYNRILAEEVLYARSYASEDERSAAIAIWIVHYNYHRPHSATGGLPPATKARKGVTNVMPSYT